MNDPIPFCHDGVFHVYYQHNPGAPVWGDMHWGHATSSDLISWKNEAIALYPDKPYDKDGVFTGSIVEQEGRYYAFYTGIPKLEGLVQVQCLATSDDLYRWNKVDQNPLITDVPAGFGGCFRDPQVFKVKGEWWMVIGSQTTRGGAALLYTSSDLYHWNYRGPLHEAENHSLGEDYECPDFFPLGDRWVLITSRGSVHWQIGDLDGYRSVPTHRGVVDTSEEAYYAAKSALAWDGRRILFAWLREPKGEDWEGALALPRELFLKGDGALGQRPALEALYFGLETDRGLVFEDQGIRELFPSDGPPTSSWHG